MGIFGEMNSANMASPDWDRPGIEWQPQPMQLSGHDWQQPPSWSVFPASSAKAGPTVPRSPVRIHWSTDAGITPRPTTSTARVVLIVLVMILVTP